MKIMAAQGKSRYVGASNAGNRAFDVVNGLVMLVLSICILYPLYYVLVASFTDPEVVSSGKLLLWPESLYLGGYERIFQFKAIWTGYGNTIVYTILGTALSLAVTIPAAYALSRKDMLFRKQMMFFFTFTMFFSGGMIPLYLLIRNIHIYDTIGAIILPVAVSVYNLIVCRSYFENNLPNEMLEAAVIDGCDNLKFFFRIALPLSATIVTVMILFYGTALWNSFMNALMFLSSEDKMPLQVILRNLILIDEASSLATDGTEMALRLKIAEQLKYGVIVVSALPLLAAYPFLQKYITKGVMIGAVKG